ncbi:MAG: hypothetical protein HKN84_06800 [Gammaproteobacteria bacterium]|nr:hypothetical protein [Gammaproteobacteria bacterium]
MMRLTLVSLLGFFVAVPAFAQDGETAAEETIGEIEAFDREPVRCIIPSRIDRTEVIDEQTVVFHMRGSDAYVNRLPNACRSLAREKRFSYDLRTNRLCSVDSITVLEWWGSGLNRGMSCGLGEFYPITQEEAELLDIDPGEMREAQGAFEETSGNGEDAPE